MYGTHRRGMPSRRNWCCVFHRKELPPNLPVPPAQNSTNRSPGIVRSLRTGPIETPSRHAASTRTGHNDLRFQLPTIYSTEVCLKMAALETTGGIIPQSLLQIRGVGLRLRTRLQSSRGTGLVVDQTGEGYLTKVKARKPPHAQDSGHLLTWLPARSTTRSVFVLQVRRERSGSRHARHYSAERVKPKRGLSLGLIGQRTSLTEEDNPH